MFGGGRQRRGEVHAAAAGGGAEDGAQRPAAGRGGGDEWKSWGEGGQVPLSESSKNLKMKKQTAANFLMTGISNFGDLFPLVFLWQLVGPEGVP